MTVAVEGSSSSSHATTVSNNNNPNHSSSKGGGVTSRLIRMTGRTLRNSMAVMGVAAVAVAYNEYKTLYPNNLGGFNNDDDDKNDKQKQYISSGNSNSNDSSSSNDHGNKKKVLVIPFHRIQIVAEKDPSSNLRRLLAGGNNDNDPILQYQVNELVELIHQAASDPSIGALYGIFGHSTSNTSLLGAAGWADLEEIRNALRVFRESHRRHTEPNLEHGHQIIPRIQSKPLYAYTDTFADTDSGNKQYYLASIFTHVHLQKHGELNLFGIMSSTQFFIRGFLERHGIVMHVLKHGPYKTAPNIFTEWGMNRAQTLQVTNILQHLQHDVCLEITASRSKALLASWLLDNNNNKSSSSSSGSSSSSSSSHYQNDYLWKRIHNSGTFPALTAWKAGLVDYLPRRDPLTDLVHANVVDCNKEEAACGGNNNNIEMIQEAHKDRVKAQWDCQETDFDRFQASQIVTLEEYQNKLKEQKLAKQRHEQWAARKRKVQDTLTDMGLWSAGTTNNINNNKNRRQEIALLHVNGTIGNDTARKLINSIRKIRTDNYTKCVVVHVTSPGGTMDACETIAQELQALSIPIIFSFGNVAASGGYYIAAGAHAHRIFCSKKSLTGSIGVFCLRPDLTPFAARYGINVEHVTLGNELAGTFSPFHPLTRKMKNNLAQSVSDKYAQFKNVVSLGRGLDLDQVEALAQGQVWTGIEAKMNGLVDEVGGLDRAIAYARRNFTDDKGDDDEFAQVVVWPKKTSLFQQLLDAIKKRDVAQCWVLLNREWQFVTSSGGGGHVNNKDGQPREWDEGGMAHWLGQAKFPVGTGSMILAADEDTAIRILLEGASGKVGGRSWTSMLPPPSEFWM